MEFHFSPLKRSPVSAFSNTPDPEFLFVSPDYQSALQDLTTGIAERRGLMALIGEPGLGKTTLLQAFLETIDPQRLKAIYLFYPKLSIHEILEVIYQEFGLIYAPGEPFERINHLRKVLIEEYKKERNVALIIDEAHNVPPQTLEYLLILANLQIVAKNLIQVVLVGQSILKQKLKRPLLQQPAKRHAIYTVLSPLKKKESIEYIRHRLSKAAINDAPLFTRGALKRIVTSAQGNPRILNSLCANALILGALSRQKTVSSKIARKAIADFETKYPAPHWRWVFAGTVGLLLLLGLLQEARYTELLVSKIARLDLARLTLSILPPSHKGAPPANTPVPATESAPIVPPQTASEAGRMSAAPSGQISAIAAEETRALAVPTPPLFGPHPAREGEIPATPVPPREAVNPVAVPVPLTTPAGKASAPAIPAKPLSQESSCLFDAVQGEPCLVTPALSRSQAAPVQETRRPIVPTSPPLQEDCLLNTLLGRPCAATQQESILEPSPSRR
jgi:general secretion pathway protein A